MKRLWWFALTMLVGAFTASAWAAGDAASSDLSALPPSGAGESLALVTFTDRSLARAPAGSPGDIYASGVDYSSTIWGQRLGARIARKYRLRKVTEWPVITLGVHCVVFAVENGQPLDEVVEALTADPRVTRVYPMNTFRAMSNGSAPDDPYIPLQKSVRGMNLTTAHQYASGRGVTVAVVDTGIDGAHIDLRGQVAQSRDLVADADALSAVEGHGTAVAGVIAALADNRQGIVGVAPAARLLSLRACWSGTTGGIDGVCNTLTLAKALDSAIRMKAQVINLSLSGPRDELLEALVLAAMARGAAIVGAMPADEAPDESFPTSVPGVIRVNAEGLDHGNGYSIEAPGSEIFTTLPHDTYGFISGSSIAAAHVSGVIALLLEMAPALNPAGLSDILERAQRSTGGRAAPLSGLDACAAVAHLDRTIDCRAVVPPDGRAGPLPAKPSPSGRVSAAPNASVGLTAHAIDDDAASGADDERNAADRDHIFAANLKFMVDTR